MPPCQRHFDTFMRCYAAIRRYAARHVAARALRHDGIRYVMLRAYDASLLRCCQMLLRADGDTRAR